MVHRKKSYQLLICRVAKNLPVLELLNHFIKSSTVAYKRVAYKKNLVYIVCTCHPTCFIQHANPFIFSFDVKSKMATYMLLPVILSELVDSDDEKPRRGKTREWIKQRHQLGSFQDIIKELIVEDRYAFKEMFRMSVEDFETVLKHIDDHISPQEIQGGHRPVLSDERLALALRFLANGESFQSLSFQFRISRVAVSYIIKGCCDAIVERMVPIFISLPFSPDGWHKIAAKFENRWNYPHALGAVDGKHPIIKKPVNCESYYYNYKKTYSVTLMAIAGPDYKCLRADIGCNGRNNDGRVWNKSGLHTKVSKME